MKWELQELVRDVVIGMADGLTVPFALAAGIAGALPSTHLIISAGLAEVSAGCIAMGLGGYLAVKSDHDYYHAQRDQLVPQLTSNPAGLRQQVEEFLQTWGLDEANRKNMSDVITDDNDRWLDFVVSYNLGIEHPRHGRARSSSLTIGLSYVVGGIIPLSPYLILSQPLMALKMSVIVTIIALFLFGYAKGRLLGTPAWKSAFQTTLVGGLAAAVAYFAASWIA